MAHEADGEWRERGRVVALDDHAEAQRRLASGFFELDLGPTGSAGWAERTLQGAPDGPRRIVNIFDADALRGR